MLKKVLLCTLAIIAVLFGTLYFAVDNQTRRITQARGKHNALPEGRQQAGPAKDVSKSYLAMLSYSKRMMKVWKQREGLS